MTDFQALLLFVGFVALLAIWSFTRIVTALINRRQPGEPERREKDQ